MVSIKVSGEMLQSLMEYEPKSVTFCHGGSGTAIVLELENCACIFQEGCTLIQTATLDRAKALVKTILD